MVSRCRGRSGAPRFYLTESHGYKCWPVIGLAPRPDGSLVAMVTDAANKPYAR